MHTNKKFLDPQTSLFRAGLGSGDTVVDLGAGSGFFAQAAAQIVGPKGMVYVVDILEKTLEHVNAQGRIHHLRNIKTIRADLEKDNLGHIPSGSAELVVVANLLHQMKDRKNLIECVYRLLKTGGRVLVIDWNSNHSPMGPKATERISEQQVKELFSKFKFSSELETDNYHYGLIFIK